MDFILKLKTNAYDDLSIENHQLDLHGWMDAKFELVFKKFILKKKQYQPLIIVEVGSWKGLSTCTMAKICKECNIQASIIAIDTWLGAQEFWTWGLNDILRGKSLNLINGYPSVYNTFVKNVKLLDYTDLIAPLPLPSKVAADVLEYYNIKADIIYIDAAHDYDSVKQDITVYQKIAKTNTIIFGDDYTPNWPGVEQAVDEILPNRIINGVIWSYDYEYPDAKNEKLL